MYEESHGLPRKEARLLIAANIELFSLPNKLSVFFYTSYIVFIRMSAMMSLNQVFQNSHYTDYSGYTHWVRN